MQVREEERTRWQYMSTWRVLMTLATTSGVFFFLGYILQSARSGFDLLIALFMLWLGFAAMMPLAGVTMALGGLLLNSIVTSLMLYDHEDWIMRAGRWLVLLAGLSLIFNFGVPVLVDGWYNNRMTPPSKLYAQCIAPQTRKVRHAVSECMDSWNSPSIGRRGACSHHGGVVMYWVTRNETYQPHDSAFCRKDARNRSWVD